MLEKNTTTSTVVIKQLNGSSVIADTSGNNSTVITFSANIEKENGVIRNLPFVQQSIINPTMYIEHMDECRADMKEFNDYVDACLKED
jgi:hypothetical protein